MSVRAEEGNACHILEPFLAPGSPVVHLSFLKYELYCNAVCILKANDFLGLNAIGTTWEIRKECLTWSEDNEFHSSSGWYQVFLEHPGEYDS